MFRSKNYKESSKLIDKQNLYEPQEALSLVCQASKAKFDETVELHVKLGVDGRHADQQVRGAIVLPNGTGKTVRVLCFCPPEQVEDALAAGADYAGGMEYVEKIQKENWFEFDTVIANPKMMGTVGRLGKILGPRLDKTNIIHCPIGKVSFGADKLYENYVALLTAIIKAKPAAAKGQYIRSCVTASTMGPGVKINAQKQL